MGSYVDYTRAYIPTPQALNQPTESPAHIVYPVEAVDSFVSLYNTAGSQQMFKSRSGDSYRSGHGSQASSERANSYTQNMSRSSSYMEDPASSPLTQYSGTMSPTGSAYGFDTGSIQPTSDIDTRYYDFIECEDPNQSYYQLKLGYEPEGNLPYTVLWKQRESKDKQFVCLYAQCASNGKFRRAADLDRHYKDTHVSRCLYDCPDKNCNRVGDNGFKRYDHLVEHRRTVHVKNIPKKGTSEYEQWKKHDKKRSHSAFSQ